MVVEIPVNSDLTNYQFQTTLEGLVYGFNVSWNDRLGRWVMSIYDGSDQPLVESVPVMAGPRIMEQYVTEGLPRGGIIFLDTSGESIDPGRMDLGDRVRMFYITSDDEVFTVAD